MREKVSVKIIGGLGIYTLDEDDVEMRPSYYGSMVLIRLRRWYITSRSYLSALRTFVALLFLIAISMDKMGLRREDYV